MTKKKLTIVKIGNDKYQPTSRDFERWRLMFRDRGVNVDSINILSDGKISAKEYEFDNTDGNYIMIIRVGGVNHLTTPEELETWCKTFADIKDDPDFRIFCATDINIQRIKVDEIIIDDEETK